MPSDFFAHESPMGASTNSIPRLALDKVAGNVQLNAHSASALYLGDLTQYWTAEEPYLTSAMAFNQHADKRHPDYVKDATSGGAWRHFTPIVGYHGFTPQNGPRNKRALTVEPMRQRPQQHESEEQSRHEPHTRASQHNFASYQPPQHAQKAVSTAGSNSETATPRGH
eukprot:CAMPEP_0173068558 /NCGR_PEP_ID=MMETSP1102-20130122/7484_1 /TAXON_ID=49646 /ORGANISM="Geminigera sp., Strain Caron Lab Isolate" /LENGTH=167 /DNA_ID=CAMNT_0013936441 /DNA_START=213 /DNA_END=716 /DNA_ORIENTATION=+